MSARARDAHSVRRRGACPRETRVHAHSVRHRTSTEVATSRRLIKRLESGCASWTKGRAATVEEACAAGAGQRGPDVRAARTPRAGTRGCLPEDVEVLRARFPRRGRGTSSARAVTWATGRRWASPLSPAVTWRLSCCHRCRARKRRTASNHPRSAASVHAGALPPLAVAGLVT